jgi:NTP pyrophosphatase (non-canonical NTP hydrolase)
MTLNDLRDKALAAAIARGWTNPTFGESIALIHSELSEALEEYRNGLNPNENYYVTANNTPTPLPYNDNPDILNKPAGIPSELADTLIRILHLCGIYDIDAAVATKMAYNETRAYRHGGKRL